MSRGKMFLLTFVVELIRKCESTRTYLLGKFHMRKDKEGYAVIILIEVST